MGWEIGFDSNWNRDIGYGVPAICDHPGCNQEINRGLGYVCGGEPYGGDDGCGLYFCDKHMSFGQLCDRCYSGSSFGPFDAKPDSLEWVNHKLTHESWEKWREENPAEAATLKSFLRDRGGRNV